MECLDFYVGGCFWAPPHHYVVPSPYKQGESAVRIKYPAWKLYSVLCYLYSKIR